MADDDLELGHVYVMRYLALKKAGVIGPVWPRSGGVWFIAPPTAAHPAGPMTEIAVWKLRQLIDELDAAGANSNNAPQALPSKIGPQSEVRYLPLARKQSA